MDMRQITPRFFAAPQITAEDIPAIKAAGVAMILCNRPDEEVPPGYRCDDIRDAAEAEGLGFAVQPLTHQTMTPDVIARNTALMNGAEGPVLAYCASGTRSTIAWALGSAGTMAVDDIIAAARAGGYDLTNMRQTLEMIAAQSGT